MYGLRWVARETQNLASLQAGAVICECIMGDNDMRKDIFPVSGMSCASCAARVNKVLNKQDGVYEANVNYASATARVVYDPSRCTPSALRAAVRDAGYDLMTDAEAGTERVAVVYNGGVRFRTPFLHQCVAAAQTSVRQYGHAGGRQHGCGISLQRVQSACPRLLAFKRHTAARLFRVGERHHSVHPAGQAAGVACQREDLHGDKEAHGTPAQDGDEGDG